MNYVLISDWKALFGTFKVYSMRGLPLRLKKFLHTQNVNCDHDISKLCKKIIRNRDISIIGIITKVYG